VGGAVVYVGAGVAVVVDKVVPVLAFRARLGVRVQVAIEVVGGAVVHVGAGVAVVVASKVDAFFLMTIFSTKPRPVDVWDHTFSRRCTSGPSSVRQYRNRVAHGLDTRDLTNLPRKT